MRPYIHHSFWSDEEVENQSPELKLCALWIITNSQRSILGVCEATTRRFVFETGLSADVLANICDALPGMFIKVGAAVFIRNFIRHQFGSGDKLVRNNFFKALASEFKALKDPLLCREILSEYPEFESVIPKTEEGLSNPLPRGTQAQEKRREEQSREEKDREEESEEPSDAGIPISETQPPAEAEKPAAPLPATNHMAEPYKIALRAHKPFLTAWKEWRAHMEGVGKTMSSQQEDALLAECAKATPERATEVLRHSILKGAKNPIWDAPRSKATRSLAGSGSPEPDPEGFKRWMAENYPDKEGTPFAECPEMVQGEFRRSRKKN